jgi:branched-chain amino acid transport system ATP-binding protein
VAEIWRVIDEIKASGMAVLIVDRDWHKVLSRSNRALVLQKGLVVLHGEAADMLQNPELPNYLGV